MTASTVSSIRFDSLANGVVVVWCDRVEVIHLMYRNHSHVVEDVLL